MSNSVEIVTTQSKKVFPNNSSGANLFKLLIQVGQPYHLATVVYSSLSRSIKDLFTNPAFTGSRRIIKADRYRSENG